MKTEISAQTISYDESGMGPPVVLLQAFPLSRSMWAPQIEALHDAYRVIAPDLRGFGGSKGFDDPPSLDQVADDVAGGKARITYSAPEMASVAPCRKSNVGGLSS